MGLLANRLAFLLDILAGGCVHFEFYGSYVNMIGRDGELREYVVC